MKKILVIFTTAFVPYGGLTSVMMNYWRAIDKRNLQFDFASTNEPPKSLINEISKEGSMYYKLPPRKHVVQYFIALKKLSKDYDIAHIHGNSSTSVLELYACKISGVKKRIIHNHNSLTEHPFLNKILHPWFAKSYTYAMACSEFAGDWIFGKGKYNVLRNAIDINKFECYSKYRAESRNEFDINENDVVIGHIGKFNKQKNYPMIISIFSEFHKLQPNSKLLLVGEGDMFQEVKEECIKLGIVNSVVFSGIRTDIPYLLSAMDIFLFPSLWEGLPLSVLEAQASGLPTFISDAISKEVCICENVNVFKLADNPAVWAEAICQCNIQGRNEQVISNNMALTYAGYNIKCVVNSLKNIYLS